MRGPQIPNPLSRLDRQLLMIAALVSIIGMADAFYLTLAHLATSSIWCANSATCSEVLQSAYAAPGGVPLAGIGTLAYCATFSLAILAAFGYRHAHTLLALLVAVMLAVTLVLLFVQSAVLHAFCGHCLLSAIATVLLTGCVFVERCIGRKERH